MLVSMGRLHHVFEGFGADLPFLTLTFVQQPWILGVIPGICVVSHVLSSCGYSQGEKVQLACLVLVLPAAVVFGFAMYLPIFQLGAVVE